jgi:hypothetical protein
MGDENNHLFRVSLFAIAFAGVDVGLPFLPEETCSLNSASRERSKEDENRPSRVTQEN